MSLVLSICVFAVFGIGFVYLALALGALVRPRIQYPEKLAVYECGEPGIGSGWVQFDLRFYIVALVFLVFDVEVALFYPWAVAFGSAAEIASQTGRSQFSIRLAAAVDMLFFFGVLLVGYAYLWRFGYLDWVRSAATTSLRAEQPPGIDLRQQAPSDREL